MRSLLALVLPALALAAPPKVPEVYDLTFSGTGCPNDSGSVAIDDPYLGDSATLSFSELSGSGTGNCQVHLLSKGASAGWQVAISSIAYEGDVHLRGSSQINTYTTVYWSENAAATQTMTGSLVCRGPEIRDWVRVSSSAADLAWSQCTGADGYPGILNVNFRPVAQGDYANYNFHSATWKFTWRRC